MEQQPVVAIIMASKKRHIAFDGVLLCENVHKSTAHGYSNGNYCTYMLDQESFTEPKRYADVDYRHMGGLHTTGTIPFIPLSEIELPIHVPDKDYKRTAGVIESSICKICLRKYAKALKEKTNSYGKRQN